MSDAMAIEEEPVQAVAMEEDFVDEDIFGGDSDLSDIEDEAPAPARKAASASGSDSSDDDDDDDAYKGGAGSDGEFKDDEMDASTSKGDKAPRKKKSKEPGQEGGSKKKKKAAASPSPEVQIDPELQRKKQLEDKIDGIIRNTKKKASSRRRKGEDDLDAMNDEEIIKVKEQMLEAVVQDGEDLEKGRATNARIKLLPRVINVLQKADYADSMIENGMLEAIKMWLEPLPDHSLPSLPIQKALFGALRSPQFIIETSALKSSGLGKIVLFYSKSPRINPAIARIANQLVADWMRPIIKRSKAVADRAAPIPGASPRKLGPTASGGPPGGEERRHARIPQALVATFSVRPQGMAKESQGSSNSTQRFKDYKRKMDEQKKKVGQV